MNRLLSLSLLALALAGCDAADLDGPATVTGTVLDSQRGEPLAGATVTFARGQAERSAVTDAAGTFRFDGLAGGAFTVTVRAEGYLAVTLEGVEVTAGGLSTFTPFVAVAVPPAGAYRILLSWGAAPLDLDAHLTGPDRNSGRFHVYFGNRAFGSAASLDLDATGGFGPETVTLFPGADGSHRYSVYNYSDPSPGGAEGIAGEGGVPARVQVYTDAGLVREYRAPAAAPGNTWRVFELNVSGGTATFTDLNQYVDANGSGDLGVFRTGRK